jgi:hypothetical protein
MFLQTSPEQCGWEWWGYTQYTTCILESRDVNTIFAVLRPSFLIHPKDCLWQSTVRCNEYKHEYEKGNIIKNVVFLRRQFPGKQQCWCQIWHPKSGIHVLRICVESLVQIGKKKKFNFDLWPSMTLTLTKFDLTEINPSWAIPGSAYTPLPSFVKLGPRTWERNKCDLWAPTTLTFAETNP